MLLPVTTFLLYSNALKQKEELQTVIGGIKIQPLMALKISLTPCLLQTIIRYLELELLMLLLGQVLVRVQMMKKGLTKDYLGIILMGMEIHFYFHVYVDLLNNVNA